MSNRLPEVRAFTRRAGCALCGETRPACAPFRLGWVCERCADDAIDLAADGVLAVRLRDQIEGMTRR
jgi:hypothetical protein